MIHHKSSTEDFVFSRKWHAVIEKALCLLLTWKTLCTDDCSQTGSRIIRSIRYFCMNKNVGNLNNWAPHKQPARNSFNSDIARLGQYSHFDLLKIESMFLRVTLFYTMKGVSHCSVEVHCGLLGLNLAVSETPPTALSGIIGKGHVLTVKLSTH